jgi:transposase-like protein
MENLTEKNGFNKKTIKGTSDGTFELEIPRDRNGTFEPQIVKIHRIPISFCYIIFCFIFD